MVIVLITVLLVSCDKPVKQNAVDKRSDTPLPPDVEVRTSGTYNCLTCTESQEWYTVENHLMYWDEEPYIPHALMDLECYDGWEISEYYSIIDRRMKDGITEFTVQYRSDIELTSSGASPSNMNKRDIGVDKITDYIESKGGTYIFFYWPPTDSLIRELAATESNLVCDQISLFENEADLIFPIEGHWNLKGHLLGEWALYILFLRAI